MRTKAEKLEKGKWYADVKNNVLYPVFLKFSHKTDIGDVFSKEINGPMYDKMKSGMIGFGNFHEFYLPTPEDIEKYGLIDDETT